MMGAATAARTALAGAKAYAREGNFPEVLLTCHQAVEACGDDTEILLDAGGLLLECGFLGEASILFTHAHQTSPGDFRPLTNLAKVAQEAGNHAEARRLYTMLQQQVPDNPFVRRNTLTSLEYDPAVPDEERLANAKAWGVWAVIRAGGDRPRPPAYPLDGRPLRVGYVSADFCHHPVGLFLKDILHAHDKTRVTVFAYSAGSTCDWVTSSIRHGTIFRDVAKLDDLSLATLIRQDRIDLLVDLSGHTAGSRLTVCAYRPAPVQISWLGYFATTGLACMDAILLDDWHAPPGTEAQFVEPIIRLPYGRFCYQPAPWAPPEVAPPPCLATGQITFGCFNNTAKLNTEVFDLWARILAAVPASRLVLKWRTFNDESLRQSVRQAFMQRGIGPERLELRGPSFHANLLQEYADIDIALDPFPFTGGFTSCETLWMGVPVVTWPRTRVVSRQTSALLGVIGLQELVAGNADDYVRIAVELAHDHGRLTGLRSGMRQRMLSSPLLDVNGFTRQLEEHLIALYQDISSQERSIAMTTRTVLHVGSGHRENGARLPAAFQTPEWREIRLDIDPANDPDIVGSMLDMAGVASETIDAVYAAHNLEHVHYHEVPAVLGEFLRVLKPEGFAVIGCPDLQTIGGIIAEDRLTEPLYRSPAGPISPHDIIYGHGAALAAGHFYMAHKCGFTLKTLTAALQDAGFQTIAGMRREAGLDIWTVASKNRMADEDIRQLATLFFPGRASLLD